MDVGEKTKAEVLGAGVRRAIYLKTGHGGCEDLSYTILLLIVGDRAPASLFCGLTGKENTKGGRYKQMPFPKPAAVYT